jgi:asparagine synthase (glutamine-hydrolysing)
VFIAGFFNHVTDSVFSKLDSIVGKKICGERVYFKNDLINIIAGKTSSYVDQGTILNLDNVLLLGKVFCKKSFNAITKDDLRRQPEISNQLFVNKYWGNYLYVRVKDNEATILRDPVGQTPLFYTELDSGECLFSSDIETLINMMKTCPGFNWQYFSSYVLHAFITSEKTAFNGIYELPHGSQLSYNSTNRTTNTSLVWNPLNYFQGYKGSEHVMDDIVNITSNVIDCWTKNADIVSLDFSGGTDSTSLLLLLNKILNKNKEIKLINQFHPDVSSSDERKYARATAMDLGLHLIEFDHSDSLPYDPLEKRVRFKPNWPTSILSYLKVNNDISSLSEGCKNVTYMSGHGGDHIFMCPPPVTSLCDYLIEKGGNGFNTKAMELYAIFREPIFSMASKILNGIISYYLSSQYAQSFYAINKIKSAPWFNKDVYLLEKQMHYHPFFDKEKTTKSLPGKFWLIEGIYSGLSTIKTDIRDDGTNPIFFPLFSQPLLELALSIPTYESYRYGYNRYLFRKAISDTFNTNAVWRQDKGETSGIEQRGLKRNEKRILELCLDGKLVKQGLVNKEKLHTGILKIINGQTDYQWAITDIICAETFMNYWN